MYKEYTVLDMSELFVKDLNVSGVGETP